MYHCDRHEDQHRQGNEDCPLDRRDLNLAEPNSISPGFKCMFDRHQSALLGQLLSGLCGREGKDRRHRISQSSRYCLQVGFAPAHRWPILRFDEMEVALDAIAQIVPNIRWQSITEEHGLSESAGFLTDISPGAIDICPYARGQEGEE